jgi:uncharacterized membrane protein
MRDVRVLTEGPMRAGSRVQATMGSGPLKSSVTWELTAFDPARLVSYQAVSDGRLGIDGIYRLAELPDGRTQVTAGFTVRTHGILRVLEPLLRGEVKAGEAAELERMKVLLEAEAVGAEWRVPVSA